VIFERTVREHARAEIGNELIRNGRAVLEAQEIAAELETIAHEHNVPTDFAVDAVRTLADPRKIILDFAVHAHMYRQFVQTMQAREGV
jgi:hypothetical protein